MSRHDGVARVSVVDHGAGIDEAFKPSIFGRFMQADSTMTRSKGGTGLPARTGGAPAPLDFDPLAAFVELFKDADSGAGAAKKE